MSAKLDVTLGAAIVTGDKTSVRIFGKRVSLSDLALRDDAAKDPWFSAKEVRTAPFDADLLGAQIELPKIDVMSPLLSVAMGKDGIDVARKLVPAERAPVVAAAKASNTISAAPKLSIAGIAITGGRVNFTDSTLPTAITHVIDAIKVSADRIELDNSRPHTATTSATLASGGAVQVKLKFDQRSNEGEAEITVERVTLAALSLYLNRNTRLQLGEDEAAIAGRVKFSSSANAIEAMRFEGSTAPRNVKLIDETTLAPFAQGAELSTTEVTLADLLLDQPPGKLVIAQDGTVNLTQIGKVDAPVAQPAALTKATPAATDAQKKPRVKVDRLQVTGGYVEFADLSLRPQFGVRISALTGVIVGLSTWPASRAEVSMEGKVDEFGLARPNTPI